MPELKIDPIFRDLIPALSDYEKEALEAEIRYWARAYSPIITWNGTIIDGHHRYEICKKYNLSFKTEKREFEDQIDAEIFILKNQRARRNLPIFTLAVIGFEIEKREESRRGNNQYTEHEEESGSVRCLTEAQDSKNWPTRKAAKASGMSHDTYAKCKYIDKHANKDQKKDLHEGKTTPNKVYIELKQKEKAQEIRSKLESIENQEVKATQGVYDVISIDPPWQIGDPFSVSEKAGYKPLQYPTMSVEEIKELDIPCAEDCHVFLWTTQKFLFDAFDVLDTWGLEYVCTFTWVKNGGPQPLGLPQYNTEFFIYARKGKAKFIDTKNFFTALEAKRTGHSSKPEKFYELLRRVTAGRRLDMFNRREIEGFDRWGNEASA